jgi:hypothetical protein
VRFGRPVVDVGWSDWVIALTGSEVASVISAGMVRSSELSSAKGLRPGSEAGWETLVGKEEDDEANVWHSGGGR